MSTSVTAPTTLKSNSPVPLDTIPISPANENADPNMTSEDGTTESNGAAKSGDEQVTVFHDPENFNVKHPLMHEWTLWFTKPPSGKVTPVILQSCFDSYPDGIEGRQLERSTQGGRHLRFCGRVLGCLRESTAPLPLPPSNTAIADLGPSLLRITSLPPPSSR